MTRDTKPRGLLITQMSKVFVIQTFERGDLKMAAHHDGTTLDFDAQNNVKIQFIDKEDFPLEHRASLITLISTADRQAS